MPQVSFQNSINHSTFLPMLVLMKVKGKIKNFFNIFLPEWILPGAKQRMIKKEAVT
jgi:hypothetical protein